MAVDEFTIRAIGLGALLPAATAAVAAVGLGRCPPGLAALGGPLALAAGVWAGAFALSPDEFVPTRTGWTWLPHLAALALPVGWAVARFRSRPVVLPLGVLTAFGCIALIVPKWPPLTRETVAWTLALGEWALVVAVVLVYVVPVLPKAAVAVAMGLVAAVASLVLFAGGNARIAQTTGVVAAALGGAAVVAALVREETATTIARGLAPGFAVTLIGLAFSGYYNSYETKMNPCYPLVALAPVALAVALAPAVRRLPAWGRAAVAAAAMLILLGGAAARAALVYAEG